MRNAALAHVEVARAEDFQALPALSLSNGRIRVDVLSGAGPRLVRAVLPGVAGNLLAEVPDMRRSTPWGAYSFRGGHRLWHAPESFPRTYVPDDAGASVHEIEGGVRIVAAPEGPTGIRKALDVRLEEGAPRLTLTHTLRNEGLFPVEVAPWALTMLPLGGVALLPGAAPSSSELTPNRELILWPYTAWDEPRVERRTSGLSVRGQAGAPLKIGTFVHAGWVAYARAGTLLVKRFRAIAPLTHADRGCNVEVYCADAFLELETLGPLARLGPGEETSHVETWDFRAGFDGPPTVEGVARFV
jgi:hypothetical protein